MQFCGFFVSFFPCFVVEDYSRFFCLIEVLVIKIHGERMVNAW